jgi:ketosteroid isomerase-like protein
MSIELAKPIAAYFAAEHAGDADEVARCFAEDGVVQDEGGTFRGAAAIREWNARARDKYHHTVEPLHVIERDGQTIVTGRVSGDFPGSPVNLDHVFSLEGDKIASLDIH